LLLVPLVAAAAHGAVTATPSSVSAFPGQTTQPITLNLTFGPSAGGIGVISTSGMPAGTTTVPAIITYNAPAGATSASTSFSFAVGAATIPGTYIVTLTDTSNAAGATTVTLIVNTPTYTANAVPNPVRLTLGASPQQVVVSTMVDPGFNSPEISYSFSGFPGFIANDGPKITSIATGYGPVAFRFSLAGGAVPGTYSGTLTGTLVTLATKNFPFTVVVPPPDIAASFTQPVVQLCNGQTVGDSVQLSPVNGYSGTPTLTFTSAPAGITINPASPPAAAMPPGQTVPFTISASGASSGFAVLNVRDLGAGINKNIELQINVVTPNFTPGISPSLLALNAGGSAQTITAFVTPIACFNSNVTVTASGQPPGLTITPNPMTVTAAGYPPAVFSAQAAPATAPGTYPITFTYTGGGITKTLTMQVNVSAAPDFALNVNPASLTIAAGSSGTTAATITPINGFSGTAGVTSPSASDVTFSPATFSLGPGSSQPVTVAVAAGATPGVRSFTFTATAPGVSGTRTATLTVTIPAAPDFALAIAPSAATVSAGGSLTATVTASALNGSSGPVSVVAPSVPGIVMTPSVFTITPGGAGQPVSIAVAGNVIAQTIPLTFNGISPFVSGTRTTTLTLTVTNPPSFLLTLTPNSITIPAGGSVGVIAGLVAINGFTGVVTVTAPMIPGVVFTPSTFTLTPGATQGIIITADASAPPGQRGDELFRATSPGIANGTGATLALTIGERRDFSIAAMPPSLTIRSGSSAVVTLTATGVNGFAGAIAVAAPSVAGLTFSPSAFTLAPGTSKQVTITASAAAVGRGPLQAVFSAIAAEGLAHNATVIVTVLPPLPILVAAVPTALVAGAQSTIVRVAGDFLQPGAQFNSSDSSLIIEESNVLTAKLADVRMTVRSDAVPGPRNLSVANPDGGVAATPLVLFVYPPSAIAAPLDVLAAAIVFPARGMMIAPSEAVSPRGLLATAGTGTIIGSWQFDGMPFDRFVVNAAGGLPVEVRTNVPIPASFTGSHTLAMIIESPRKFVSPEIEVTESIDRVSRLTLLAPRDGAVIRGREQKFRWSLVPNCSGYDVEVAKTEMLPDALTPMLRFHVADAEWRPNAADIAAIGPGIRRWRVRARCAGETALEPTSWQRFAILPEHADIFLLPMTTNARGTPVVRWEGGVTGLLYRVEFLSPSGETIFSALTSQTEYALVQGLPAGMAARVSVLAPNGGVLGTSSSSLLSRRKGRDAIHLAQTTAIELGAVEPADGATVSTAQPHIAAEWKGAAKTEEITLLVDSTDMTAVAKVTPTSIAYDPLVALAPGPHTVTLTVAGNIKRWTFTVGAEEGTAAPAAAALQQQRGDWVIAPVGTVTLVRAPNNQGHTQISAMTDLNAGSLTNKATGDVSLKHELEPSKTVQESRNWIGEVGAQQQEDRKETVRFGFSQPDFFDQAQFLNAGFARGGVQAKIVIPGGVASYYETFTGQAAGIVTGLFNPEQSLKAASIQIPLRTQWEFRILAVRVDERAGFNSAGGVGRAFGFFTRFALSQALNAVFEGARGDFTPSFGSVDTEHRGNAVRLGLNGIRDTLNYAFNIRRTEAEFVNPANRGLTAGGVPDRTAVDLTVGKFFGTTSITIQLRHLQDGTTSRLLVPRTRQTGGVASLTKMLGEHVTLAVSGNLTADRGEEKPEVFLPRADRNQSGATGALSEVFGRFNFAQTLSRQLLRDHVNDLSDQTVTTAMLASGGQLTTWLNLSGTLSGTRTAASPIIGMTNQMLASLQPMISIPVLFLTLQPRATYSTTKNDLLASKTTTEQYQGLATFAPQWLNSIIAVQLSTDWSRNRFTGQAAPAKFVHNYAGTFNLHWRFGAGPAYGAQAPPPGAQPVAPASPAASPPK